MLYLSANSQHKLRTNKSTQAYFKITKCSLSLPAIDTALSLL